MLYWLIDDPRASTINIGGQVGYYNAVTEYWEFRYQGVIYKHHRVIFELHHGFCPEMIDHIDQCKTKNRIENLREADKSLNAFNTGVRADSKTKVKGVCYHKATGKYNAQLNVAKNKRKSLGFFETIEEASAVYQAAFEALMKELGHA